MKLLKLVGQNNFVKVFCLFLLLIHGLTESVICESNTKEPVVFGKLGADIRKDSLQSISKVCGKSTIPTLAPRIVGGRDAKNNQWPWMVFYEIWNRRAGKYDSSCGGALINRNFVLTAAHCVVNEGTGLTFPASYFKVTLGTVNPFIDVEAQTPLVLWTILVRVHQEYNMDTDENDIAMLQLNASVDFRRGIKPICLPTRGMQSDTFEKSLVNIAGWGDTRYGGKLPAKHLKEAVVAISHNRICQTNLTADIYDTQICAGGDGKTDTCQGDSGGPMMLFRNKRYYIIGVVSIGYKCAVLHKPARYTRVTKYLDWIEKNTQTLPSSKIKS